MTATATADTRKVLLAKAADYAYGEQLSAVREFTNPHNGKLSYELQFANNARVIMPGNWTLQFDLVQGASYNAYWEEGTFHLEEC